MANAHLQALHQEWQSAVSAHAIMINAGRASGLTARELDEVSRPYILRIDLAYLRLKEAEAQQRALTPAPFHSASAIRL